MTPPDSGMEAATPDFDAREVDVAQEELRRAAYAAAKDTLEMLGAVLVPLPLAQRILAALEQEAHAGDVSAARLEALADELRAVIGK